MRLIRFEAAALAAASLLLSAPAAADLIISEYTEGTVGTNKAIELYNPTSAPIDMAAGAYKLHRFANGGTTPGVIALAATIAPGATYVIGGTGFTGSSNLISSTISHNGDDGYTLVKGAANDIVDSFGNNTDPGTNWGSGATTTLDNTLRRKGTVCSGDSNFTDAFDPAAEWDGFGDGVLGGFGAHTSGCLGPSITIDAVTEAENAACVVGYNDFVFTVTASAAPAVGRDVGYSFTVTPTATGSPATAGDDFEVPATLTGTIANPATSATITVPVQCDIDVETDETFEVTLTAATNATLGANAVGLGTITNDDVGPTRTLSIANAAATEGDAGNVDAEFAITLSEAAPPGGLTFDLGTADLSAEEGVDYVNTSTVGFTIAEGETTATFSVPVIGDVVDEPNETFVVNVSNATDIDAGASDLQAIGTITDDDGVVQPDLSVADLAVNEGNGGVAEVSFVATLTSAAPAGGVTFDADTTDVDATDGVDYDGVTGAFTIPEGETSVEIDVAVRGDTTIEPTETFTLALTNVVNANLVDGTATGTITNDDTGGSIADASATEGDGGAPVAANLVFTLTSALTTDATLVAATTGGTATANADYVPQAGTPITIAAGATTVNVPVQIVGDIADDDAETVIVTVTTADPRITLTDATATLTITDNDDAAVEIHAIQGAALRSALAPATGNNNGQVAITRGNVVTAVAAQGFTIQTPAARADQDPLTSQGLFVFTNVAPQVTVGQVVDVKGPVAEFFNYTQLVAQTLVVDGNAALPPAVTFDQNTPSRDPANLSCGPVLGNFECYESMRVHVPVGLANSGNQTFGTDPVAEVFVTAVGTRARREEGVRYGLTPPAGVPVWDGNPEVFELDADKVARTDTGPVNPQIVGGTVFEATGVIGYDFGQHELWATSLTYTDEALPRPVPAAPGSQLTIGSFNVLRLCESANCVDDGQGAPEPAPTPAEIAAKVARLSDYIRTTLRSPAVMGLQEVETLAVAQQLAAKIAADGGPAYVAYLAEGNDPGGIDNAFLVDPARVTGAAVRQLGKDETINDCSGTPPCAKHDRPPYLLEARYVADGADFEFAVINNHTRSRTTVDTGTVAETTRVRAKRFAQGVSIANYVQRFQTGQELVPAAPTGDVDTADVPLFLVGDYNAFEVTDGWADVVGLVAGTYDNAKNQLQLVGGNIVDPPLLQTSSTVPLESRYSYAFAENFGNIQAQEPRRAGAIQIIDHGFANAVARPYFKQMVYGNTNADAPAVLIGTGTTGVGSSDHDGFVLYVETGDVLFANGFE